MSCGICKAFITDGDFGIYICIKAISIKSNYTTLHYKHSYALFVVCSAVNFKDTSEHFRSFDSHNFTLSEIGDAPYNSLWPRDTIWRHISRSTLAQVMACCLTAPSHYLNHWSSVKSSGAHIRAISQEMPLLSMAKICLKITYLKFHSNFPGANHLMILSTWWNAWDWKNLKLCSHMRTSDIQIND